MPRLYSQRMVAALGDSLTMGVTSHNQTWCQLTDLAVFPARGVGNFGVSGWTTAQIRARYTAYVAGNYPCMTVLAGINDLRVGTPAATIWTNDYKPMLDDAISRGIKVLALTQSPWGAYSLWTSGRQAEMVTLNNNIKAYVGAGYSYFDLYAAMGAPGTPQNLNPAYDFGDGLHFNDAGAAAVATAIAAPVGAL